MNTIEDLDAKAAAAGVTTSEPERGHVGNQEAVFDNSNYDDPSMIVSAVKNSVVDVDEHLPRFGLSLLLPIALYRQNGNNSYCDVNRKDPNTGFNQVNFNYYPPFRILPLVGGTFNIPAENLPDISSEPTQPAEFDFGEFQRNPRQSRGTIDRSARECSEIFMRETEESGSFILHSLTGFHHTDTDKGARAAVDLLGMFLPVREADKLPVRQRVRAGVTFTGPFLDEIAAYVRANGDKLITKSQLSDTDKIVAQKVLTELKNYLQSALSRANGWLDETEAEIRNPQEIKKSYDVPNYDIPDAPVPVDLYCLAHVNRVELDNKQIEASGVIGSTIANPMVDAVEKMTEALHELKTGRPATVPAVGVMTEDDVQKLLDANTEKLTALFEQKLAEMAAPAAVEPTQAGETASEAESPKTKAKTVK